MNTLPTLGKFMLFIPMMIFGLFHFMNGDGMTGMVPSYFPSSIIWVYLTGAALIAAGIGIFIGKKAKLAAQLLGLMLVLFALLIHLPAIMGGDQASMPSLLKDLALAGGIWFLSGSLKD
ncbi:MAG: DoxX family protein [Reichenbachiella sp.]